MKKVLLVLGVLVWFHGGHIVDFKEATKATGYSNTICVWQKVNGEDQLIAKFYSEAGCLGFSVYDTPFQIYRNGWIQLR
jgi:hypothetical protein